MDKLYLKKEFSVEQVVSEIEEWLKSNIAQAGCRGVVIGLSGGIDSSVVAAISKRIFPDNTLGLILPCYSDSRDEQDALTLVKEFELDYKYVDLGTTYDAMVKELDQVEEAPDMALANIKPRLRMAALYYYAQINKYLVLGTSNKSELVLGYFTKYGDGAADLLPIASFTKMEVYEIAKYLEIPKQIIERPPTAGIISGQTDEDEMGFTYQELEQYFKGKSISSEVREKIEKLEKINEHKRAMPPIFDLEQEKD